MEYITIIVAADLNHAIGANGNLPWHLPQDLKFFKNTTWAMPVIMGRKTFESLGKPLPGRTNIVITKNLDWTHQDVWVASSLEKAIELAKTLKTKEIFVIGGGFLYQSAIEVVNRVYLTRVNTKVEHADTWFPELKNEAWEIIWERSFAADEKHPFDYSIQCWERRK